MRLQTRPKCQADARGRDRGEAEKSGVEDMICYGDSGWQWPFSQRFSRIRRRLATCFVSQKPDSDPSMLSSQEYGGQLTLEKVQTALSTAALRDILVLEE